MGDLTNSVLPFTDNNYTVIINPGHGAAPHPEGAKVKLDGKVVYERDINDAIAERLRDKLTSAGVKVIYADHKSLVELQKIQEGNPHAFFLSIHCDSANKKLSESTIYAGKGKLSAELAKDLKGELSQGDLITQRPIRDDKATEFAVLRKDSSAAALVECGNMRNKNDLAHLISPKYQDELATRIANGSVTYLQHGLLTPEQRQILSDNSLFASSQ